MIIPNIWKNKSHVPNHQPEILDKHCIALFHGTCGYSLTALDPAKPFFNAPLDAGSRRRPNSAVAYILTRGNPRGWWKTTGILYDLTIQNRDFTTESWIIWIWVCWNMGTPLKSHGCHSFVSMNQWSHSWDNRGGSASANLPVQSLCAKCSNMTQDECHAIWLATCISRCCLGARWWEIDAWTKIMKTLPPSMKTLPPSWWINHPFLQWRHFPRDSSSLVEGISSFCCPIVWSKMERHSNNGIAGCLLCETENIYSNYINPQCDVFKNGSESES